MEIQNILTLIQAFTEHSLTELNVEDSGVRVCLKREAGAAAPMVGVTQAAGTGVGMVQAAAPVVGTGTGQPVGGVGAVQTIAGAGAAQADMAGAGVEGVSGVESDRVVTSPLVGIFYSASSPEAEAFVKVGDRVKKGQVLGIIEAMKLMNEIESEYDGVVEAILVKNEDVVEYGQPLFRIR